MLVVSPHFDDAVLSCWHLLDGEDDVRVVNVFGGSPPPGAPPGWWDQQTGAADPATRVAERRSEDEAALALAGLSATELGFLDGQHRQDPIALDEVEASLRAIARDRETIAAPMALDEHEDHCIARDAALALRGSGAEVVLYADLPHASLHGWPEMVSDGSARWRDALRSVGVNPEGLRLETHLLSPEAMRRKRAALANYRTQLAGLEETYESALAPEVLGCEAVWRSLT
jgi:LmbE family N-acetylglucosaminyl deacetylase